MRCYGFLPTIPPASPAPLMSPPGPVAIASFPPNSWNLFLPFTTLCTPLQQLEEAPRLYSLCTRKMQHQLPYLTITGFPPIILLPFPFCGGTVIMVCCSFCPPQMSDSLARGGMIGMVNSFPGIFRLSQAFLTSRTGSIPFCPVFPPLMPQWEHLWSVPPLFPLALCLLYANLPRPTLSCETSSTFACDFLWNLSFLEWFWI